MGLNQRKSITQARRVTLGGLFLWADRVDEHVFFEPIALAMRGHKKTVEAAHLGGWPVGSEFPCSRKEQLSNVAI